MQPPEMNPRITSREQVSRIDRGYYRRTSRLQAARGWLVAAGLAAAVGWCAWGASDPVRHHAPGPVVAAHARWERDCQACHVPLSPIEDDTFLSSDRTRHLMAAKCEACHRAAAHHPLQVEAETGSCVSCHADHRGRSADISRVADRTCTACHADIARHRLPAEWPTGVAASPAVPNVTRFDDEGHPEFASLARDPGRLKFSHGRHMAAGLVFGAPTKEGPLTWEKLAADDRDRLMPAAATAGDAVQLSCASCHEFATSAPVDAIRQTTARLAASPPGAYPLPVSFERHCAACHKLPYDPDQPGRSLPHGLAAEPLRRFLLTALVEDSAAGRAALDGPVRPRALPANTPAAERPSETLRSELHTRLDVTRSFSRGVCGKCHDVADVELPAVELLRRDGANAVETWFRVPPVQVPDVWLAKARFSHVPHRAVE